MTAAVPAPDGPRQGERRHDRYDRLIATAQSLTKRKVALVHPCDCRATRFETAQRDAPSFVIAH